MTLNRQRGELQAAVLATIAVGAALVAGTLLIAGRAGDGSAQQPTAEYGRRLLRNTALYLGPDHENPAMRYTGTRMSCGSCHLETGTSPGTLSLLTTAPKYPRESGRDGGMRDLRDRINGCMQRSMNGRPLARDSVEMMAMERYILGLNSRYQAMGDSRRRAGEQAEFVDPDRAASIESGREVYERRCQVCHGADGGGLKATQDPADGYLFPPLWGPDSYNNGAGMNRVLTAARFIKARMPLGQADLSDDEAYDVAAYINAQPRPQMANLEKDYPDRSTKPIDSPYPPYADDFPHEQHRLGPFRPIREYYDKLARPE